MSLLWYQKTVFDKYPMLSLSLCLGLFFISIQQQCMLFWIGIGTLWLMLFRGKMKLVREVDLVCDCFYNTKKLWVTNREPPELSLCTYKPVWRFTFKTPWGNFMGNEGFLQMFMWWMDCIQKIKYLLLGKFSI